MRLPSGGFKPPRLPVPPPGRVALRGCPGFTLEREARDTSYCALRVASVAVDGSEQRVVDEVGVLGVPLDVRPDERAQRHDRALGGSLGVEGRGDERRADALALAIFVDLGVHEDRPAAPADVTGESDHLASSSAS